MDDHEDEDDDEYDEYDLATAFVAVILGMLSQIACSASVLFLGVDFRAVLLLLLG